MSSRDEEIVSSVGSTPVHQITWRKFDFTQIFELYGGWKGKMLVWTAIACMCYGVLWAYASVFSSSVASLYFQFVKDEQCIPFSPDASTACKTAYHICLLVYASVVIVLACLDMGEQVLTLTVCPLPSTGHSANVHDYLPFYCFRSNDHHSHHCPQLPSS